VHRLTTLLPCGVARRAEVVRASSASSVARWLRRGDLVQLHPGILVLPGRSGEWAIRSRAASLWADGPLSHLSAVVACGMTGPQPGPVHVTVPYVRSPERRPDVVAHRTTRQLVTVRRGDVDVVEPVRSLVDAWAYAHSPGRNPRSCQEAPVVRQALIEGVRRRDVRVAALRRETDRRPRHPGRSPLLALLDLLADGCQSELEIWGAVRVLPGPPDVPPPVRQHRVRLASGRWVQLDAAWPGARVAVELDGAAFHGSREARERDLRRDTALAALGWVVLRFSYARLMTDPAGCRREIAVVVRSRLVQ
jgi:REase_MTES_1575